jgi:hypothetical protein
MPRGRFLGIQVKRWAVAREEMQSFCITIPNPKNQKKKRAEMKNDGRRRARTRISLKTKEDAWW